MTRRRPNTLARSAPTATARRRATRPVSEPPTQRRRTQPHTTRIRSRYAHLRKRRHRVPRPPLTLPSATFRNIADDLYGEFHNVAQRHRRGWRANGQQRRLLRKRANARHPEENPQQPRIEDVGLFRLATSGRNMLKRMITNIMLSILRNSINRAEVRIQNAVANNRRGAAAPNNDILSQQRYADRIQKQAFVLWTDVLEAYQSSKTELHPPALAMVNMPNAPRAIHQLGLAYARPR